MGVDIIGWVEVRHPEFGDWMALMSIRPIVDRNYGVSGSLFGRRNTSLFKPVAPARGLPSDISPEAKEEEAGLGGVDPSWLLWSDIKVIDWDELEPHGVTSGHEQEHRRTRKEILTLGWVVLFKIMEALALRYGDDGVRLVIWFDS